ncbi:MAG: hypothetical protein Q4B96_02065 [Bacillota bacterium]|nr:hypothetical protein [Bacillota bacterium]
MNDFWRKCRKFADSAADGPLPDIVLLVVAALLLISLMTNPALLVGLALFGLFLWAILYC